MRLSRLAGLRLKETPSEAAGAGEALLLRGGYLRLAAGGDVYLLPAGLRVVRAIERILREELERIGGQEIRLRDEQANHSAAINLCRQDLNSYTQLPLTIFNYGRGNGREVPSRSASVLDPLHAMPFQGFSFAATSQDAQEGYTQCKAALEHAFARMGLIELPAVSTLPPQPHEAPAEDFFLPDGLGDDSYAESERGSWSVTLEAARSIIPAYPKPPLPLEKVHTPGTKTIRDLAAFLGIEPRQTAKAVLYDDDGAGRLVMVLIRGDREVNEAKLGRILDIRPQAAGKDEEDKIRAAGIVPGFASPLDVDPAHCRLVIDETVRASNNLVTGANEQDVHFLNFNLDRDLPGVETVDVAMAAEGDLDASGKPIVFRRGLRLGGVRSCGSRQAEIMNMAFRDREGMLRHPEMTWCGADTMRLFRAIVERHHDDYGPKWPAAVAPWPVHLCALRLDSAAVREAAENLYADLQSLGIEVLFDDRNAQAGVQFAEADLLGAPLRLTVGERGLKQGVVEWKGRASGQSGTFPVDEAAERIQDWLQDNK